MKNTNTLRDMEDREEDTPGDLRSRTIDYWPNSTVSEALLGINHNQSSLPNTGLPADLATVHDSKNDANNPLIRPDLPREDSNRDEQANSQTNESNARENTPSVHCLEILYFALDTTMCVGMGYGFYCLFVYSAHQVDYCHDIDWQSGDCGEVANAASVCVIPAIAILLLLAKITPSYLEYQTPFKFNLLITLFAPPLILGLSRIPPLYEQVIRCTDVLIDPDSSTDDVEDLCDLANDHSAINAIKWLYLGQIILLPVCYTLTFLIANMCQHNHWRQALDQYRSDSNSIVKVINSIFSGRLPTEDKEQRAVIAQQPSSRSSV